MNANFIRLEILILIISSSSSREVDIKYITPKMIIIIFSIKCNKIWASQGDV